MKIIAMYLPQFHTTPENDTWWGKGFTEWTAVRNALPMYEGHKQPKKPLNRNYYNLLEKLTMQWQVDLMKKYEVDGLCFYHYWFKDGRQILEKPAENLLQWKDIDMPFCFSWANESWVRSWSNIDGGNVWMMEKEKVDESPEILLEQKYGGEEEWKKHFLYLLPFFKDERYIKIDEKPIFLIYKAAAIPMLKQMLGLWNELAIQNGFKGIYIIGSNTNEAGRECMDAELIHEPQATFNRAFSEKYIYGIEKNVSRAVSYDEVWRRILATDSNMKKTYYGGFVNYDDTPRRGEGGSLIYGGTPEKFSEYLTELCAKNAANANNIVFINAWNEWGEGMYLEPDEEVGHQYLEAIRYAKNNYAHRIYRYDTKINDQNGELISLQRRNERLDSYWRLLHKWMLLKEQGKRLDKILLEKEIHTVAIYGLGILGKHLFTELQNSNIKVCYGIDKEADNLKLGIPMYHMEDELEPVDCVIVSTIHIYEMIKKSIKEKKFCNQVLSLEGIVDEC